MRARCRHGTTYLVVHGQSNKRRSDPIPSAVEGPSLTFYAPMPFILLAHDATISIVKRQPSWGCKKETRDSQFYCDMKVILRSEMYLNFFLLVVSTQDQHDLLRRHEWWYRWVMGLKASLLTCVVPPDERRAYYKLSRFFKSTESLSICLTIASPFVPDPVDPLTMTRD